MTSMNCLPRNDFKLINSLPSGLFLQAVYLIESYGGACVDVNRTTAARNEFTAWRSPGNGRQRGPSAWFAASYYVAAPGRPTHRHGDFPSAILRTATSTP